MLSLMYLKDHVYLEFPTQLAKNGIVWFVKVQMELGIIAGIGQSILSTALMIRGVFMGDWLSKFFLKPLFTALTYMVRIYNIEKTAII